MNYYPFHIGDYIAATRHLSWDEDAAYRRLLDWAYSNERPLPLDTEKVCRLVVATSDAQRQAVTAVLSEFFDKTEDGWHHARVDQELAKMREKQEASEERDEHEKTRQQKHRERRSAMFAQLADVGIYPAWNAKTGELERLIAENCDKPVTQDQHSHVTAHVTAPVTPVTQQASQQRQPATAIPTPTPTPTPKKKKGAKAPLSSAALPTWMQGLIDLWHEILPELPGVVVMNDDRKRAASDFRDWVLTSTKGDGSRRATNDAEMLAWTREFFTRARANDFIMGRGHRAPEHQNWRCSFEYLLSAKGMQKVIEQTQVEEQPA